ncbi:hypothetical protein NW846_09395 [Synechococcus sp. W60.3]
MDRSRRRVGLRLGNWQRLGLKRLREHHSRPDAAADQEDPTREIEKDRCTFRWAGHRRQTSG